MNAAFRFRAQPALDLRKREDDEAQGVLARAEMALHEARRALDEAARRARHARDECAARLARPGPQAEQFWHQSWIVRLDREREQCAALVAARERAVADAAAARARTRMRLEALERFKEKAADRWARQAAAEERKQLDALATVRFVARRSSPDSGAHG